MIDEVLLALIPSMHSARPFSFLQGALIGGMVAGIGHMVEVR